MGEARIRRGTDPRPAFRYPRSPSDAAASAGVPCLLADVEVRRQPGHDFDPFRRGQRPDLSEYLARRLPSAPPDARWRICGGFLVRVHDAGHGVAGAVAAFRLPDAPYYALLNLVSRQGIGALSALRASTSTDGLTLAGGFLRDGDGPPSLVGTAEPFDAEHAVAKPGTLTVVLPDWDANSLARILGPFGVSVRTA